MRSYRDQIAASREAIAERNLGEDTETGITTLKGVFAVRRDHGTHRWVVIAIALKDLFRHIRFTLPEQATAF